MKNLRTGIACCIAVTLLITACSTSKNNSNSFTYKYTPDDQQLYDTIVYQDSVFFQAYNTCNLNLEKYAAFYADNVEFYHDKGGLSSSKQDIVDGTKKNVCGKVTRELIKGSIEVYPIKGFGAIEMGLHRFHNNTEKEDTPARAGKFVIIWQHINNEWKITRVVSLH